MSRRPRDYLKQWFDQNQSVFDQHCISRKLLLGEVGSAASVVELDFEKFVTNILVWDQGYCIDIEIINLETDEVSFPVAGPNASFEEYLEKLDGHLSWLKTQLSELNITK